MTPRLRLPETLAICLSAPICPDLPRSAPICHAELAGLLETSCALRQLEAHAEILRFREYLRAAVERSTAAARRQPPFGRGDGSS